MLGIPKIIPVTFYVSLILLQYDVVHLNSKFEISCLVNKCKDILIFSSKTLLATQHCSVFDVMLNDFFQLFGPEKNYTYTNNHS